MAKHCRNVEELVEIGGNLMKDTCLCEQENQNIAKKLTKETYKKYDNDAKSVRMWA
jgi:hypothetical protein